MGAKRKTKLQVLCDEDCGNAPKKQVLLDLSVALAGGEREHVASRLAPDVAWEIAGKAPLKAEALDTVLAQRAGATRLRIANILTHGAGGAVDGTLWFADGREMAFCDVYRFASAKGEVVRSVTTYALDKPSTTKD